MKLDYCVSQSLNFYLDESKYPSLTQAFGGGPLVSGLGDMLIKRGVNLVSLYGGTEFGLPVRMFSSSAGRTPEDWQYLELSESASPRWVDQGDGSFELQLLVSCFHQL
jgi:hypothetical protein